MHCKSTPSFLAIRWLTPSLFHDLLTVQQPLRSSTVATRIDLLSPHKPNHSVGNSHDSFSAASADHPTGSDCIDDLSRDESLEEALRKPCTSPRVPQSLAKLRSSGQPSILNIRGCTALFPFPLRIEVSQPANLPEVT